MSDSIIEIKNVNKWFGDFQVLKDISLEVQQKQKIVVCGPSGSGKSTLIRCINRLEEHQEGNIIVDGNETIRTSTNFRSGFKVSWTIIRWTAAKMRNCKSIVYATKNNVV